MNDSMYGSSELDDNSGNSGGGGIPLPELDLDHSYISLFDESKRMKHYDNDNANEHGVRRRPSTMPLVQVTVFGSEHLQADTGAGMMGSGAGASTSSSGAGAGAGGVDNLEFIINYAPNGQESSDQDIIIVRRSFDDLEWLHDTFKSHTQLGGTLCGRILPPFPSRIGSSSSDYGGGGDHSTAVAMASAGVGMVSSAAKTAKSLWGSLAVSKKLALTSSKVLAKPSPSPPPKARSNSNSNTFQSLYSKKYVRNVDTPQSKARQVERYLNYMLEHPALSTSFPLHLILQVSGGSYALNRYARICDVM